MVGHSQIWLIRSPSGHVLQRAFQDWRNVDKHPGDQIEAGVRAERA